MLQARVSWLLRLLGAPGEMLGWYEVAQLTAELRGGRYDEVCFTCFPRAYLVWRGGVLHVRAMQADPRGTGVYSKSGYYTTHVTQSEASASAQRQQMRT